jgi:hypothetical protein
LACNYCLLGATNDDLAEFFGVRSRTIDNWIATHEAFVAAVRNGRDVADAKVVRGLFRVRSATATRWSAPRSITARSSR